MSKFFRSGTSDSTSSSSHDDDSSTHEISRDGRQSSQLHPTNAPALPISSLNELSLSAPASASNGFHKDMLLHALLEERCMNDVLKGRGQRRGRRSDDASIQAEARARYQQLVAKLAPNDLIASGFENDSLSPTRQRYRDGLDYLSRTLSPPEHPSVPPPLRRLLTDGDALPSSTHSPHHQLATIDSATTSLTPLHPVLEPSRYLRDFDELGILGKGGYGTVYHVKHRLDNIEYAVKKIPISASRMARIRSHGQRELDDLLRELRTLARLEHPNIVRYFGGWIEWADVGTSALRVGDEEAIDDSPSAVEASETSAGAESDNSLRRVYTQSSTNSAGILFEQPLSLSPSHATDSSHHSLAPPQPTLSLHLQMSLHPLTLSSFLFPSSTAIDPLKHCFHLRPSLSIILALLDGVDYLHTEGIVHRDLKPANIFLAAGSLAREGDVDLSRCEECRAEGRVQPVRLNVRIGDFGLVSAVEHPAAVTSGLQVGTALYRPPSSAAARGLGYASPRLDLYALGVIAFELLWRFETRMERQETLGRVKEGVFPEGFRGRFGCGVEGVVRDMLDLGGEGKGVGCMELRERFRKIPEAARNGDG
ncbi:Protein tyrosine kinase [Teratosphaeria destructans]|uniref:Protein tyrosine kinase n=1 Tax=Teratosphaeria destructans TaxID=418781 RepID=A0A9W7SVJ5_9PEZI|nr:Protein tyrosine kinase [Teratosphaeria destructans]